MTPSLSGSQSQSIPFPPPPSEHPGEESWSQPPLFHRRERSLPGTSAILENARIGKEEAGTTFPIGLDRKPNMPGTRSLKASRARKCRASKDGSVPASSFQASQRDGPARSCDLRRLATETGGWLRGCREAGMPQGIQPTRRRYRVRVRFRWRIRYRGRNRNRFPSLRPPRNIPARKVGASHLFSDRRKRSLPGTSAILENARIRKRGGRHHFPRRPRSRPTRLHLRWWWMKSTPHPRHNPEKGGAYLTFLQGRAAGPAKIAARQTRKEYVDTLVVPGGGLLRPPTGTSFSLLHSPRRDAEAILSSPSPVG